MGDGDGVGVLVAVGAGEGLTVAAGAEVLVGVALEPSVGVGAPLRPVTGDELDGLAAPGRSLVIRLPINTPVKRATADKSAT